MTTILDTARRLALVASLTLAGAHAALATTASDADSAAWLSDLSLEELLQVEITSVSKTAQKLADVPAAVFVITQDDIRRSGATSVAEALRLAPGVDAARISDDRWAVSVRGFNGRFANKLLVLVDGRSVYTPLFSGVMWEDQDLMLEDVERIEVIRGPGASIWGANAVNGVVNILSKAAKDTQGGLVSLAAGDELRLMGAARYGIAIDEDTHARIYVRGDSHDAARDPSGVETTDTSRRLRGGFRLDAARGRDRYTLLADAYDHRAGDRIYLPQLTAPYAVATDIHQDSSAANLHGRWERHLAEGGTLALQVYYSHTTVHIDQLLDETRDTLDIDLHHSLRLGHRHSVGWGANYRHTADDIAAAGMATFSDATRSLELSALYLQDEIALTPDNLRLTLGARAEHHDFTGWELQPNARLLWQPSAKASAWLSAARASRTPSRGEHDIAAIVHGVTPPLLDATDPANFQTCSDPTSALLCLPIMGVVMSSGVVRAEHVDAFEVGFRGQWQANLSGELVFYHHRFTNLIVGTAGVPVVLDDATAGPYVLYPFTIGNSLDARVRGLEASVDWRPRNDWRLQLSYTLSRLTVSDDSLDARDFEGNLPRHLLSVRASHDLTATSRLDLWLRHVCNRLATTTHGGDRSVDDYTTLDVRLAWKPRKDVELAVVGQNLLDSRHLEYVSDFFLMQPTAVERSLRAQLAWQF